MADLSHITIEHAPNKTTYRVGDRFERYGMAVRAHYTDGTSSLTDFYSYSPTGALSTAHTQITVELSGKTATQSITVLPAPASGYFPDKYLGSAEYGANPCVNAADGSFSFRNDSILLGTGSYSIGITISYRSRMTDRESDLVKGLPKGWRTDWHRFLIQDGVDSGSNQTYKYIDGDGLVHTFVQGEGMPQLYDKEGQGMLLDPTTKTITDLEGNSLTFDSYGRLISIASGSDPGCEKVIEYNSDGIRKIYDARDTGTYVKFSYQSSFIRYIRLYQGGEDPIRTYTLGGFPGQITSLEETVGNSTRTLYQYAVNDRDLLRRVVDCMTKDAWRITYAFDQNLNAYRIDSLRKGYLNGDSFVQHEGLCFVDRKVDPGNVYGLMYELVLSNDDGIDISLFTDSDGRLVLTMERDNENSNYYYSLIHDEGKWLGNQGNGPERISGSTAKEFYGSLNVTDISISPTDLGGLEHVRLIGYIKIKGRPNRARISASCQEFSCGSIDINPKAYYAWQYFELPIERSLDNYGHPLLIQSFSVSLMDGSGHPITAEVANLQLAKGKPRQKLYFLNGGTPVCFDEISEIRLYYSQSEYINVGMNSPVYMKESDLLLTMREAFRRQSGPWMAYFNNGQEVMGYNPVVVGVKSSSITVPFMNPTYVSNEAINTNANWFFAESLGSESRTYYRFSQSHYEVIVRSESPDVPLTYEYETFRYDYYGHLTLHTNKNGTKTKYEYFPDGRLKKSGILTQDGSTYSTVLYEATMAQDGRSLARVSEKGASHDYQYYSDGLLWKTTVNSVQGGQTANTAFCRELSYDAFRDDVAGAMFKDGETIREEHSYSRPSQSYKTNHLGDIAGRLRISHEISTRTTSLGIHDGSGYADVMTSQESAHSVIREYDNVHSHGGGYQSVGEAFDDYGFPTSISYGGVTMATFSYAENFASRYCSLLEEVTDLFSGRDVSIVYGDDNEVSSVQVGGFAVSYFTKGGVSCCQYDFGGSESYVVMRDGTKASASVGTIVIPSAYWLHGYDALGRLSSKTDSRLNSLAHSYAYSDDSPSRVSAYSFGGGAYYESYTYGDGYGNLTGVSVYKPFEPNSNPLYSSTYSYDGLGRIVSETNTKLGISRSYQYESFGDHASGPVGRMVSFGNASMEYDEKGRLVQFGSNFYSYDHYGNRVSKNQISYQWERGTLLSYCGLSRFEYDYRGLRSLKVDASGLTHEYFYDGERLVGEDVRDGSSTVRKLRYFYDLDGLCALRVTEGNATSDYVCIRNPLGDIVGLSEGSAIKALYVYDAWGNHKVYDQYGAENTSPSFIGNVNPFRYRGYYFDFDTGLYYLRARYYDPEVGQFISPDDVSYIDFKAIGGLNLYAYCNYNPIRYFDRSGHIVTIIIAGFLVGALIGVGVAGFIDYQNDGMLFNGGNGDPQWYDYLGAGIIGGVLGAGLGYLSTLSWTINIPIIGLVNQGGVLSIGLTHVALNVSGAAIAGVVAGAGLLSGSIMLSKGFGPRMGHNQYENKQFEDLCKKHHLTMKERERLHRVISHQNYSYKQIEEIIWSMFGK